MIAQGAARLSAFPSGSVFLDRRGKAPPPGSRMELPELAGSLRAVAAGGREAFYTGELAQRIVKANAGMGGILTESDLASYEAQWREPIGIGYRGYQVYAPPPNSSGFQILQTLKLMEGFGYDDLLFQHPDALHLLMEAVKLCVTDRIKYAGDPDDHPIPIEGLLSDGYASRQRKRIDRERASEVIGERYALPLPEESLHAGRPEDFDSGMTTHFAAADRDGNVVSVTQTLGSAFGCGAAAGDTGILLNNMCYWFDLEEGSPNRIGPGKRVDFVVAPTPNL